MYDGIMPNGHRFERPYMPNGLVFAIEPAHTVYREAQGLFPLHWDEIAKNKELMTLNVNEGFYERGINAGRVVVVTARSLGKLVGYVVRFVFKHPHYEHVLCAEDDIHFLLPEYRRGLAGYNLIKNADALISTLGVKLLTIREKIGHEHPAMMKRLGYTPTDIVYTKTVG